LAQTMFERYGGFAQVRRIVSAFYDRALDSPVLQGYFAGISMPRLIDHQTKFVASVMDGPASFTDEALERIHAPLGISHDEFLEMARLLRETLEDFGVARPDVEIVDRAIRTRETLIVTKRG